MHKLIVAAIAVLASIPCRASNNNDQDPILLTLSASESLLLSRNRDLIASRRALEGVRADRLTADQLPNPTVSISTLSIDPRGLGAALSGDKSVDTALQISQAFERGGKRDLRRAAADYNVRAASADLDETRRQQRLLLRQAYFDLHLAQERVSISRETVMAFRRTLDAANLRLKSGDIASADVSRISVDALRSENDMRQNAADLERAQVTLAYLIGLESRAARIKAIDPWPDLSQMPAAPNDEALDLRPDVRAVIERANAARKASELASSQRTRDVTVFAQFERFPGQVQNKTVGFGFSIPLFVNYAYEGEIRRAESDRYAAQDNVDRVRALARTEIARAWADLASTRDRVDRFDTQLLAFARKAAEASEFAYKRGALGVMDLLDARRSLNATQLDAAAAHADYAKALAAWRAAGVDLAGEQ